MAKDGRIERALRGGHVTSKERDARRIEIECIEAEGSDDGYIVTVCPKDKASEPGKKHKASYGWTEPIKRVFTNEKDTLVYLKEVL